MNRREPGDIMLMQLARKTEGPDVRNASFLWKNLKIGLPHILQFCHSSRLPSHFYGVQLL